MPATPGKLTTEPATYIRARAGAEVDSRQVIRGLTVFCALVLASVVIATTVGAVHQDSNQTRLQRHGVPVNVTVTGCEGVSSGIGQALIYDICRGSYTFDGHRYNAVIGGNRAAHPVGQSLRAVTVPGDPALISTATAAARKFSPWTPFITPIVLTVVGSALIMFLILWSRRRTRHRAAPTV